MLTFQVISTQVVIQCVQGRHPNGKKELMVSFWFVQSLTYLQALLLYCRIQSTTRNLSGWNYPLVVLSQGLGLLIFGSLFCKLLGNYWSESFQAFKVHLGKERMAMRVVEAIYKLKYLIFCRPKNTREFGNWSVATLILTGRNVLVISERD